MISLKSCPNVATYEAFCKAYSHLLMKQSIMVSVSGGSDSDVMMDFLIRAAKEYKIPMSRFKFVFFDTGIESQATKNHLTYLEDKYGIEIERCPTKVPVPLGCKRYGLPFISKFISQMIERLQNHNFDFKNDGNKSFEELKAKYPKMIGALTWWCNTYPAKDGKKSIFNINNCKYLKEFMIENPPTFKISAKCCNGAKKDTSHNWEKTNVIDCKCVGLRRAEGGVRSVALKSCWDDSKNVAQYRPIFWFTDKDKVEYEEAYGVVHSDMYTKYGFKRTGCIGCPYNSKCEEELQIMNKYEPLLYKAAQNIFGQSYEYKKKYLAFKKQKQKENKNGN